MGNQSWPSYLNDFAAIDDSMSDSDGDQPEQAWPVDVLSNGPLNLFEMDAIETMDNFLASDEDRPRNEDSNIADEVLTFTRTSSRAPSTPTDFEWSLSTQIIMSSELGEPSTSHSSPIQAPSMAMSDHSNASSATSPSSENSEPLDLSPDSRFLIPSMVPYSYQYFANAEESLCLFSNVEGLFYVDHASSESKVSPAPAPVPDPAPIATNSAAVVSSPSGPVRNQVVRMHTDENGVVWIVFPYSKNREVKNHSVRCDVHTVPPSALKPEIKTLAAAAYPMVGAIILGKRHFGEYSGKRFAYEWDSCWLGWALAQLNPGLLDQKGLLQRATDNVASFVFKGCMSRNNLRSYRSGKRSASTEQLTVHEWSEHMLACPEWLPGLNQDKTEKARLRGLYEQAKEVYQGHLRNRNSADPQVLGEASNAAIKFYSEQVNGENLVHSDFEQASQTEAPRRQSYIPTTMRYINIAADPHSDRRGAPRLRINVLVDRVDESLIPDSVRYEGAVFIDVFDETKIADPELRNEITQKKAELEHYCRNPIGLVKRIDDNLRPLREVADSCGLSVGKHAEVWEGFKIETNDCGSKIKHNDLQQKIRDPLMMQRVLYEALLESDRTTKKRPLAAMIGEDEKEA